MLNTAFSLAPELINLDDPPNTPSPAKGYYTLNSVYCMQVPLARRGLGFSCRIYRFFNEMTRFHLYVFGSSPSRYPLIVSSLLVVQLHFISPFALSWDLFNHRCPSLRPAQKSPELIQRVMLCFSAAEHEPTTSTVGYASACELEIL
jgi:hypothetical protein